MLDLLRQRDVLFRKLLCLAFEQPVSFMQLRATLGKKPSLVLPLVGVFPTKFRGVDFRLPGLLKLEECHPTHAVVDGSVCRAQLCLVRFPS